MGRPDLNRRQLLAAAGGLAVAGSFGFAALGTGTDALASSARTRVRYWNLFSGGDGYNMIAMLDAFRKADPDIAVKEKTDQWNAIDPALIRADGRLWMAFGSYWTGIRMVELNPGTGKAAEGATVHHLATRPDAPYAVEGPCIVKHGRYYYLFASYGACCSGVNSTYRIKAGRSPSITGPYVDSTGKPLLEGGGDLLLAGHGRYIGTGGQAVFRDRGSDWLAYHYYDAEDSGTPKLGLNRLGWGRDGWPSVQ